MHCKSRFFLWLFVAFTLVPLAGAQVYRITDLGTLPTGTYSFATGINNFGQVTGRAEFVNNDSLRKEHAFLWTKNGGMQDLGTLHSEDPFDQQFFSSWANGVNDLGLVVGGSWHDIATNHAFIWSRTGGMQDLGTPHGCPHLGCDEGSDARSINLFGQVVGTGYEFPGNSTDDLDLFPHAFLWTRAGGMQLLGNLPGGGYSSAHGINDFGQVVGIATTYEVFNIHAFLWTRRDGMVDLGAWTALAINNLGQVVGSDPNGHAVLWTRDQGLRDLGTGSAAAINDFGLVVGGSMLWSTHSGMWDLNDLIPANSGWVLHAATGINIRGQVVGNGTINGQEHAFLLTPNL